MTNISQRICILSHCQLLHPRPNVHNQRPQRLSLLRNTPLPLTVDPVQSGGTQHPPPHHPPAQSARRGQKRRDPVPAVQQDLERLDVVRDDRPPQRPRRGGHVVLPDDHEDGEELGAAGDEEGGRDGVGAGIVGQDAEEVKGRVGGRGEEADREVEGEGRGGAKYY